MIYADDIFKIAVVFVLFTLLTAAVAIDLKSHRIPNLLLWPALSLGLMLHMTSGGSDGLIVATVGLAIGLAMLLPLYSIGGMGAGDVKLLGIVGCFLGPWGAVVAGMSTMIAGAVIGIAVIAWRCIAPVFDIGEAQLLGPLETGERTTLVARSSGHRGEVTYIPYAPAIAAGTIVALWYIGFIPLKFPGWLT